MTFSMNAAGPVGALVHVLTSTIVTRSGRSFGERKQLPRVRPGQSLQLFWREPEANEPFEAVPRIGVREIAAEQDAVSAEGPNRGKELAIREIRAAEDEREIRVEIREGVRQVHQGLDVRKGEMAQNEPEPGMAIEHRREALRGAVVNV